jgi:2-polyprenyl-6-methoxyphenol hydroxylase-like FAD-dependent oxidoreductase
MVPLADGRVYWYATANTPSGVTLDDSRDELLRPAHHTGRVVLIGDAAHAMTPNLGQAGCQAIEDAVVLADLLAEARCEDIPRRLAAYTAIRSPHTSAVVRRSRRMGAAAQWSFPPLVLLRDIGLSVSGRMVPHAVIRIFDGVPDWAPPHPQADARR